MDWVKLDSQPSIKIAKKTTGLTEHILIDIKERDYLQNQVV